MLGNKHLIKVWIWKVRSSWAYISFNTIQGKTRRKLTGKILQFKRTKLWTHSSLVTNFTIFWYDVQHRISMCQPQWLNHNVWKDWKKFCTELRVETLLSDSISNMRIIIFNRWFEEETTEWTRGQSIVQCSQTLVFSLYTCTVSCGAS